MAIFRHILRIITLAGVLTLSAACRHVEPLQHSDQSSNPGRGKIISISRNCKRLDIDELKDIIKDESLHNGIKYSLDCYKVRYQTLYRDDIVDADALLLVPDYDEDDEIRFAAYFHGTIIPLNGLEAIYSSLPSNFKGATDSKDLMFAALPLAAAGYCVAVPDYTGFGTTGGADHPFIYYPELVKSAMDGLVACRKAASDSLEIAVPQRDIYLTGWSQGGGLAMYIQRMLENNLIGGNFRVVANSVLAAPCSCEHMFMDMASNSNQIYVLLSLYSWAVYAYNIFCPDMNRPGDQIFRPDITSQSEAIFTMCTTPESLFQDFFLKNIVNGKDKAMADAIRECTTSDGWTPLAPLYMHQGEKDILVAPFNMEDAIIGLKLPENQYYWDADGGHDTFVPYYMKHTIEVFEDIR